MGFRKCIISKYVPSKHVHLNIATHFTRVLLYIVVHNPLFLHGLKKGIVKHKNHRYL